MDSVVQTFLDLAAIDEIHPHEHAVLAYIEGRLKAADVSYYREPFGNIVAFIPGLTDEVVGICGHTDIAAPLKGRKIAVTDTRVQTDGVSLLGGDDKTAVAAMLELATELHRKGKPQKAVELIFTVGEEAGLLGAVNLDSHKLRSKQLLVLDWLGRANRIITKSPAYYKLDVTYTGKPAHPAEWQQGINAGAVLMQAAVALQQGEYAPGVTFNIGKVEIGEARNQVPGKASLLAELRSKDAAAVAKAAQEVQQHFTTVAQAAGVQVVQTLHDDTRPYTLNPESPLLAHVTAVLGNMDMAPAYEETFGCFDANILAARGLDVVILGAAYYNPHSPAEYVNIQELQELYQFLTKLTV